MVKLVAVVLVFVGALITVSSSQARAELDLSHRSRLRSSALRSFSAYRFIRSTHALCCSIDSAAEWLVATTKDVRTYLMADAVSRFCNGAAYSAETSEPAQSGIGEDVRRALSAIR
jgi:hypothetical protein